MTRSRRQPISPRRRAGHHQRHWSLCTQSGRPAVSLLAHEARRRRLRHRQRDRLCGPPPREALRRRWSGYHPTCDGVVRHGSARLPRGCGSRDGGRLSGRNLPSRHRHRRRVRSDRGSASQRLMAHSKWDGFDCSGLLDAPANAVVNVTASGNDGASRLSLFRARSFQCGRFGFGERRQRSGADRPSTDE